MSPARPTSARPRAHRVLRRRDRGDVLVLDVTTGALHVLNPSALAVLAACDGTATVADIVESVAGCVDPGAGDVADDVRAFLDLLDRQGLLDWVDDSRPAP